MHTSSSTGPIGEIPVEEIGTYYYNTGVAGFSGIIPHISQGGSQVVGIWLTTYLKQTDAVRAAQITVYECEFLQG